MSKRLLAREKVWGKRKETAMRGQTGRTLWAKGQEVVRKAGRGTEQELHGLVH